MQRHLRDGIRTREIYRHAFSLLHREQRRAATGYGIKKALFALGPSGYPFERLVAEVLKAKGYQTEVSVIVKGKCVEHEVDVVAEKGNRTIMVECKFHNRQGVKSDVKVALYVKARFEDIEKGYETDGEKARKFHDAWLVTNTRLTLDAVRYAKCAGLNAIGWDYPEESNLQQLIEGSRVFPITALTTLNKKQKENLVANKIIICADIMKNTSALDGLGIKGRKKENVLDEIEYLRSHNNSH